MKQFIKKNIDTFIAISIVSIFAISSVLILNARFEHLNKIKSAGISYTSTSTINTVK